MKNCSSCGKELADNSKFCSGCGNKQEALVEQSSSGVSSPASKPANNNSLIFFGAAACLLIALMFWKAQNYKDAMRDRAIEIPLVAGPIKIPKGYSYLCDGPTNAKDIVLVKISNSPANPSLLKVIYQTQSQGILSNDTWKFVSNQSENTFQFNYYLASDNDYLYIRPAQNAAFLGYVVNGENRYDSYEACRLVKN